MRPINYLPRPDLLVSVFASVSLYGGLAMAQDTKDDPKNNDPSAVPEATHSKNSDANKHTNTAAEPASTETKDNAKPASTKDEQPSKTEEKEKSKSTAKEDQASTATGEGPTKTKDIQSTITSIASSGTEEAMPTLTRYKPIPTYPAPSVPPTNNAPF